MKKITILAAILCISCLTGCRKTETENTNQGQGTLEENITEEENILDTGNEDKIEETDLQADNIAESGNQEDDESENQENIEPDGEAIDLDYGIDSIEKINEYMIPEQSFDITLDDWGEVTFVSCKPFYGTEFEYASFFLIKDDRILYQFPYLYKNDNTMGHQGLFDSVDAVDFRDINNDGKDDIIVITHYFYAGYYSYMTPRTDVRIYLAGENEFYIADDMATDAAKHIAEKDMTIDSICQYILSKDTEDGAAEVYDTWQEAYKNMLCNIEDNLIDSYRFHSEWDIDSYVDENCVYIGVHDFDNDGIPELIIGDFVSVAVFTYEEGKVERVAALYETMEWGGLNYLCYKDNNLVLMSCGNGEYAGNGYVCFTYNHETYITEFYCDYHPAETIINVKPVSGETFRQQFDIDKLTKNSYIEYSKVNNENEILPAGTDEWIAIEDLDFGLIEW